MKPVEKILPHGFYRSRRGILLGVCRGIAEYFDFSVFWARTIAVGLFILTGFWPITGLYLLAALMMKPAPVIPLDSEDEQEFYDSYTGNRHRALKRLKHRFERLERRIQRMEHVVTEPEYDWDRRMKDHK
ncbi:MAG: envelope stress response membrane protein PspC [Desulfobacterales bacterium]